MKTYSRMTRTQNRRILKAIVDVLFLTTAVRRSIPIATCSLVKNDFTDL